jgi:hypothetical protein
MSSCTRNVQVVKWFELRVQVVRWFENPPCGCDSGLSLCRLKNKFSRAAVVEDGYRDVSLSVLFTHASGLRIVGEVRKLKQPPQLVLCCDLGRLVDLYGFRLNLTERAAEVLIKAAILESVCHDNYAINFQSTCSPTSEAILFCIGINMQPLGP